MPPRFESVPGQPVPPPVQVPEKKKGMFERLTDSFRHHNQPESAEKALEKKDKQKALAELQGLSLAELEAMVRKYENPTVTPENTESTTETTAATSSGKDDGELSPESKPEVVFDNEAYEAALHDLEVLFDEDKLEIESVFDADIPHSRRAAFIEDFNEEHGGADVEDKAATGEVVEIAMPDGSVYRVHEYQKPLEGDVSEQYAFIEEVTPPLVVEPIDDTPVATAEPAEAVVPETPVDEAQRAAEKLADATKPMPFEQDIVEQAYARKIVEEAGKGTEITEEQMAFLVKDHLRRGVRSATAELAFKKNGFKNVDHAMRNLEIENGATKGGQLLIQEQSKMEEILSHVPPGMRRFGSNLLKSGIAGGATAAVFSLFFPPASLAIIAGTAIGAATGKSIFGEVARHFGYKGKEGVDKRKAAFNEIVGTIEDARRLAATSEAGRREVLSKIMNLMLREDMAANKELARANGKIQAAEMFGGLLGGIGGAAAGGYMELLNAKANGVFMKGAELATPGTDGHYVKWAFDGKEWGWHYMPTGVDAQNYADSVAAGSKEIASIFGTGHPGIETLSPESLSYFKEAYHLGKHSGPALDILFRSFGTFGFYHLFAMGTDAAAERLAAIGVGRRATGALKSAKGLGGDTFDLGSKPAQNTPEAKPTLASDAEATEVNKVEEGASSLAKALAGHVSGEVVEVVNEVEADFRYQPGTKVKVMRTSGEIEDGWFVNKVDQKRGIAEVKKYTGKLIDGKKERIKKPVFIKDLDAWNAEEPAVVTDPASPEPAAPTVADPAAPTPEPSTSEPTVEPETEPVVETEPVPAARFEHLSEDRVAKIERSMTRLVMNSGDLGRGKIFLLAEGGELNNVAKSTPKNIAALLGFSEGKYGREDFLLELPEALQCAFEKLGALGGQSLDANQRERVDALTISLGKLRDLVSDESAFAPTYVSVKDHIMYSRKLPGYQEKLNTILTREDAERMDVDALARLMGWSAFNDETVDDATSKRELREIRTFRRIVGMHAQKFGADPVTYERLTRERVTLDELEAQLKSKHAGVR